MNKFIDYFLIHLFMYLVTIFPNIFLPPFFSVDPVFNLFCFFFSRVPVNAVQL